MSYTGLKAEIPAGPSSLNARQNLPEMFPWDLTEAEGVVYADNDWRKEPGASLLDANGITGAPTILAGYHFPATNSVPRTITATSGGKLFKEVGGDLDSVELATGLSTTARGRFTQGGEEASGNARKLFYANGVNPVRVLAGDGVTATVLSLPPADWTGANQPRHVLPHNGRLWGVFGHGLYGSGPKDHEDFLCAEAQFLTVYPGVGQYGVQLIEHKDVLYLLKHPEGIYYLNDSEIRPQLWSVKEVTPDLGAADTPYAAVPVIDDILLLDSQGGFHLVSVIDRSAGSHRRSDLSEAMGIKDWIRQNVNLQRLNQATSIWYEHKSLAVYQLPKAGSSVNDLRLMFDFTGWPQKVKFSYSYRDTLESLWLHKGTDTIRRPAGGDTAGKVWLLEQAARNKNGAGYGWKIKTSDTDFGWFEKSLASRRKNYDFLEAIFNPKGTGTVTAEVFRDGILKETKTFNANKKRHVRRIRGSSYDFAVRWSNATTNEDVSLAAFRVWLRPGGRKPTA